MERDCNLCNEFDRCYPIAMGNDRWPYSIMDYFNAIRRRDLCNNNEKYLFTKGENNVPT